MRLTRMLDVMTPDRERHGIGGDPSHLGSIDEPPTDACANDDPVEVGAVGDEDAIHRPDRQPEAVVDGGLGLQREVRARSSAQTERIGHEIFIGSGGREIDPLRLDPVRWLPYVRRMRKVLWVTVAMLAWCDRAEAFDSCTYDSTAKTLTAAFGTGTGTTGELNTGPGGVILADGVACGAATVTNTDTIFVTGDADSEQVTIRQDNGPWAPGFTDEAGSSDEIEFELDLATSSAGSVQSMAYYATPGVDRINAGVIGGGVPTTAVNLNAGEADGKDSDLKTAESRGKLTIHALDGNDILNDNKAAPGTSTIADRLIWRDGGGNDTVTANSEIVAGPGDDTYTFPETYDTGEFNYREATGPVTVTVTSSGGSTATGKDGFGGTDTWTGTAQIWRLGNFDDHLTATGGVRVNLQSAGGGADVISGGFNGDYFEGGPGDDTLLGNNGTDTLIGGDGGDLLQGGGGADGIRGDGSLIFASPGAGDDTIDGGPGDDVISDYTADVTRDDTRGGDGRDRVYYSSFSCFGDGPHYVYSSRTSGVTVDLDDVADDGAPGEGDNVHSDVEDVDGTAREDTLTGDGDANVLSGMAGPDTLRGGDGDDRLEGLHAPCNVVDVETLMGDAGDDLDGGAGADTVNGSLGDDTVRAADATQDTIDCGKETDTLFADAIDVFSACEILNPVVPAASPTPDPSASATPSPAATASPTVTPEPAFTDLPGASQLLACAKTRVVLVDVVRAGRKARITGVATPAVFAGKTADVLLGPKVVGSAVVAATGDLATTVPAPGAGKRPRYQLRIGTETSSLVHLDRRSLVDSISVAGGKVVIKGRITKPLPKSPAKVTFRRQTSCTTYEEAGSAKPDRKGRFTASLAPPPAPATAAVYRGETKVATRRGGKATSRSFTLARAVTVR